MRLKSIFNLRQVPEEIVEARNRSVADIELTEDNVLVNIAGHVSFSGTPETVNIHGKTLTQKVALFTDNTGSIHLLLWEQHIHKVLCYSISNVAIKEFKEKLFNID